MKDQNLPSTRIHIAVLALLELQLSQWQALHDELSSEDAPAESIAYCTGCIERLQAEVIRFVDKKR